MSMEAESPWAIPSDARGARLIVTLLHEMKRRKVNLGLATLCIGGGQGMAMIIEK